MRGGGTLMRRNNSACICAGSTGVLFALLTGICSTSVGLADGFSDVTSTSGINYVQGSSGTFPISGGAAAGDYDNDGWIDLLVSRFDDGPILYRNKGDGTFEDVSTSTIMGAALPRANGLAWADVNNDGFLDFSATTVANGGNALYINDGTGKFNNEAEARGAALNDTNSLVLGQSTSFGDYDNDGFLDMFVTEWKPSFVNPSGAQSRNRLLRNMGASNPGYYEDVTTVAGITVEDFGGTFEQNPGVLGFTARFTDLDSDGDVDIFYTGDIGTSRLFWNNGDGTFTDGTNSSGIGSGVNDMGLTSGDYDGDGDLDLFTTAIYDRSGSDPPGPLLGNRLLQNNGDGTFTRVDEEAGVRNGGWGWGADFLDYDNDGDLDLAMTNGQEVPGEEMVIDQSVLFENNGDGTFNDIATDVNILDDGPGKGFLKFDYDNDGDLDLFIVNNAGQPVLYRNDEGNQNDWLRIDLRGTDSNTYGIGALIKVYPDLGDDPLIWEVSASSTFLSQSEFTAHFGLGANAGLVDLIEIYWPSGLVQSLSNVHPDTLLTVQELDIMQVPEPSSLLLAMVGAVGLLVYSIRRRRVTFTSR